jgi:hypothetical protein
VAWPCSLDPVPGLYRRGLARPLRRRAEQSTDLDASRGFPTVMQAALGLGGRCCWLCSGPSGVELLDQGAAADGWEVGDGEDLTLIFQFWA